MSIDNLSPALLLKGEIMKEIFWMTIILVTLVIIDSHIPSGGIAVSNGLEVLIR